MDSIVSAYCTLSERNQEKSTSIIIVKYSELAYLTILIAAWRYNVLQPHTGMGLLATRTVCQISTLL